MSTSESHGPLASPALAPFAHLADALVGVVSFLAFWVGTLLPLTYVPLLASGVVGPSPTSLGTLLVINVAAMVLGHGYKRPA